MTTNERRLVNRACKLFAAIHRLRHADDVDNKPFRRDQAKSAYLAQVMQWNKLVRDIHNSHKPVPRVEPKPPLVSPPHTLFAYAEDPFDNPH